MHPAVKITETRTEKKLKTEMIKDGRGNVRTVCSCRREVAGAGRIAYIIEEEAGESRALYGTPCERFYTLVIRGVGGECRLTDVAREEEEALSLCMRFAAASVLPVNAEEILEELLYT